MKNQETAANVVAEVVFASQKSNDNPFLDITLDVEFTDPKGKTLCVPAFWAGEKTWKVRYASSQIGTHTYKTICSNADDTGLHGFEGEIEVTPYTGDNPLLKHGFLRVAENNRCFEHSDGTPFLWLGDTWWKCLCKRMSLDDFKELAADRKAKGFTLVQIVCGPYPDEGHLEERWSNEAGFPYPDRGFEAVNPAYFDHADRRIAHLVEEGIVPAIVGGWGRGDCDGMALAGVDGMKRHWRYLVARYGAYPTVWIVGGESEGPLWTETAKYVREIDYFDRPTTIHPHQSGRSSVTDESAINFDMLQTGHGGWGTAETVASKVRAAREREPAMPVVVGEHSYERHMQTGFEDVQRYVFWTSLISGSAGLTYGAAGVWHASIEGDPGIKNVYDRTTWREGMRLPGSTQLGYSKGLLEQYPWQRFAPRLEWVEEGNYAAGIPGEVRFIFKPIKIYNWDGPVVKELEPDISYSAFYFDPATGERFDQGIVAERGEYKAPPLPSPQDWVLVLEKASI